MRVGIVDCYVDEPSILGVPPYISPYPRYAYGAVLASGNEPVYATVDDWRNKSSVWESVKKCHLVYIVGGALVPGKYLRTMPASMNEIIQMTQELQGTKIIAGPVARYAYTGRVKQPLEEYFEYIARLDGDALLYDLLTQKSVNGRRRTKKEWEQWAILGARCVQHAHAFPEGVIAEIETYRGCVRWISGGCSFCTDVLFGEPVFREPQAIIQEITEMYNSGLRNFRIGGQTCIYSYMAEGIGETETPRPNVDALSKLFKGIWQSCPCIEVLHLDNANPAVIAEHEAEARAITKLLVEYTTPGNAVAFGMESADPEVIKKNNLNAVPEQVIKAIEILNEYGRKRGANGMPALLPGINILCGLDGETKHTYRLNYEFLADVVRRDLWLRRINIRQVAGVRKEFKMKFKQEFQHFKYLVRTNIDMPNLKKILPERTVMRKIYIEMHEGKHAFGRQIGTYPLLVGFPYRIELNKFVDGIVVGHGARSITCIEYPLDINTCTFDALLSVPGISKHLAGAIMCNRPFRSIEQFATFLAEHMDASMVPAICAFFGFRGGN